MEQKRRDVQKFLSGIVTLLDCSLLDSALEGDPPWNPSVRLVDHLSGQPEFVTNFQGLNDLSREPQKTSADCKRTE